MLSARGCRKGKYCDFLHVGTDGNPLTADTVSEAGKVAKPSQLGSRYAPY